jgi:hypothetical protein
MSVVVDSGTMPAYCWPSREEWAERRSTVYQDMENPQPASGRLGDYASAEEIALAIAELEEAWRTSGRDMRAAKLRAGALAQQPGETRTVYTKRWIAATEAEQELMGADDEFRFKRQFIQRIIKSLRSDGMPSWYDLSHTRGVAMPTMRTIRQRYEEARLAADEAWHQRVAETPIDDEAWSQELAWHEGIERWSNGLRWL